MRERERESEGNREKEREKVRVCVCLSLSLKKREREANSQKCEMGLFIFFTGFPNKIVSKFSIFLSNTAFSCYRKAV